MLLSSDILLILERLTVKGSKTLSEDLLILNEIITLFESKGNIKNSILLKMILSYKMISNSKSNFDINISPFELLKSIVNTIRFNEMDLYIPSKHIEWILLEVAKNVIQDIDLSKKSFETSRDIFKSTNDSTGIAISNYFLAYIHFLEGNFDKSARLLEKVTHEFTDINLKIECQFNAAILYYNTNLKRSMNLLENCIYYIENNSNVVIEHNKINIEEFLNKLRREFILKFYQEEGELFQIIEKLTTSLHQKGKTSELAASYYEAGTVFDKLQYRETALDYFIEAARLSAELDEWKLYSKSLIHLIVHFIEKGELENADIYLTDLNIISKQLDDEDLSKKSETLLTSLNKLKERTYIITTSSSELENIINAETNNQEIITDEKPQKTVIIEKTTDFIEESPTQNSNTVEIDSNQELFNSVLSNSEEEVISDVISFNVDENEIKVDEKEERIPQNKNKKGSRPKFYVIRKKIVKIIKENGFIVNIDQKPINGGFSIDIIGVKGKIRKKKIYIMLAESVAEGELSANLLESIQESIEKIVFIFGKDSRKNQKFKQNKINYCFQITHLIQLIK